MKRIIYKIEKIIKPMLPNLPTDNLYKFGFVGSIFLICLLIFVRYQENKNLLELRIQLSSEQVSLNEELKYYRYPLNDFKEINSQFTKRNSELNKNIHSCEKRIKKFNDESNSYKWLYCTFSLLSIISLGLWYFKLQRHQDTIIKKKANQCP